MLHYTENLLLPVDRQLHFNKLWNDTQLTVHETMGQKGYACLYTKMGSLKQSLFMRIYVTVMSRMANWSRRTTGNECRQRKKGEGADAAPRNT